MPSSTPDASRKKRHHHHPNKSYTSLTTVKPTARPKAAFHPSASYSEGHDTLTYITTHLPPATPSPPSSPGTPLTHSSSSSSLPEVVGEHKHDDMNDAMILSNEGDDDEDDDDDDEGLLSLAPSSALPAVASISFLIPQYDKLHQPTTPPRTAHVVSPPATQSTPLLLHTAATSSRLTRKARKVFYFLSTSTVSLIAACLLLMLLSGVNSVLWVSISTRYGLQHAYLLDQLSALLFLVVLCARCAAPLLVAVIPASVLFPVSSAATGRLLGCVVRSVHHAGLVAYTPGPFQLLLYQFSLLFSFLFSSLLAPSQVRWKHVLGCLLIFSSSLVAMIPDVLVVQRDGQHGRAAGPARVFHWRVLLLSQLRTEGGAAEGRQQWTYSPCH